MEVALVSMYGYIFDISSLTWLLNVTIGNDGECGFGVRLREGHTDTGDDVCIVSFCCFDTVGR